MAHIIFGLCIIAHLIWNIRKGKADLLFFSSDLWWDTSRAENPYTFWTAITLQVIGAIGFIAWGIFKILYFS